MSPIPKQTRLLTMAHIGDDCTTQLSASDMYIYIYICIYVYICGGDDDGDDDCGIFLVRIMYRKPLAFIPKRRAVLADRYKWRDGRGPYNK